MQDFEPVPINIKDIKPGDYARSRSDKTVAGVTGVVKSVGRVNVKIETQVQFRPDGDIHTHVHTIPLRDIVEVYRPFSPTE